MKQRYIPEGDGDGWERHYKFVLQDLGSPDPRFTRLDYSQPGTVLKVDNADPRSWIQCAKGIHGIASLRDLRWDMITPGPCLVELWVRPEHVICRSRGKCRYSQVTVGSPLRDKRYIQRVFERWSKEGGVPRDLRSWIDSALHWLKTGKWVPMMWISVASTSAYPDATWTFTTT